MAEYKDVMVYAELAEGRLAVITTELLGGGRKLADDLGVDLSAVLIGSDVSGLAQEVISFGADRVYVVDDELLADYQTDSYVTVMEKVIKQAMPQIILLGQTLLGRDLAPRLAFRLETTVEMDCLELAIDPESKLLLQTRPVYGGNALATFTSETMPQIVTVRSKIMAPLKPDANKQGEVITIESGIAPAMVRTKVINKVTEEVAGIKLEDAQVIISGGRGIGSAEGFQQLAELAKLLNGAVGNSRPPADNGWVSEMTHIGITGKIVAPDLYIAIGISGASQHISGCSGAKTIVAINKDPEANIFRVAHYGVIGDWKQVLPAFTEKVKELVAG